MNKSNYTIGVGVRLLIAIVFFVMIGVMAVNVFHQYESASFPSTTGQVYHSEVTVTHGRRGGTYYHADIYYEYKVNGQMFQGNRFRYGSFSLNADQAQAAVEAHPYGSEITVYYRASDPSDSLLSPGVTGRDFILFFPLVFVIGIFLWRAHTLGLLDRFRRK